MAGKRDPFIVILFLCLGVHIVAITPSGAVPALDPAARKALGGEYDDRILPLLENFCLDCHATDTKDGELDLERFARLEDVRTDPKVWQMVVKQLKDGEMPPKKKKKKQPTDDEREALIGWAKRYLDAEALASAGDPGPVVLRRLSNAEYTYTIRDLTGVASLDPAHEFPVDSAAGEGFTNTGESLGMSPSLVQKYLDAAKDIAAHVVLLPDGIDFSPHTTRRDQTDALLDRIRRFYRKYTAAGGGASVNLQGIKFDTNQGGLLPLENYLAATLEEREALRAGTKTLDAVARERTLSPVYLATLWEALTADGAQSGGSMLLGQLREQWRAAPATGAGTLAAEIRRRQGALWKFRPIGHIGRDGGPKVWMEPVGKTVASQELKLKLPGGGDGTGDLVVYLGAGDAGDGNAHDYAVWKNPRLVAAGQPDLPLRDVAGLQERLTDYRRTALTRAEEYLAAAAEVAGAGAGADVAAVATRHGLDAALFRAWLDLLEVGDPGPVVVTGHFTTRMPKGGNYDFINGWGVPATPSVVANSSDREVRIPGTARPHSVVAHPSPTLFVAVGWHSPVEGEVRVEARVADAHRDCGNGVEWFVQHRTARSVSTLGTGEFDPGGSAAVPATSIWVRKGDLVSIIIGPRAGNHSCDLTAIDLSITESGGAKRGWDLAKDVSADIMKSNPHADTHGNPATWHFYRGEMKSVDRKRGRGAVVPAESLLAKWLAEQDGAARRRLAAQVRALAVGETTAAEGTPDAALRHQLQALAEPQDFAPLLAGVKPDARFGRHPAGEAVDPADLVVKAPHVSEFRLPAALARGRELVVGGGLDPTSGRDGSVQLQVTTTKPDLGTTSPAGPILVNDGSAAQKRVEAGLKRFRDLFPIALCYERIVPVDEVVTLTLYHREDHHLRHLMLDETEAAQLDRMWDVLFYVAREPLEYQVAFEQIRAFATQDRPDLVKAWQSHIEPTEKRAEAFRQRLVATEPAHLEAVLEFAGRAWRRPLSDSERNKLRALYKNLRDREIGHEKAIRLTVARVLTSPGFLYRTEQPGPGEKTAPVSDRELATRLSYFLWSSTPDAELRRVAEAGELRDPKVLATQARRMVRDDRVRRLAIMFACQWLHVRDFDQLDEKSERRFPEFVNLRGAMYEETVRFFTDLFQNDGSILSILDADHTFVDPALAKFYGLPAPPGDGWRRIENIRAHGRGGILGMATTLAKQSGASRSSPILRGNWVYETLLGERLPRPPKDVPQLPDIVPAGLTARQLIEKHSSAEACMKCHVKIDHYGFALEKFDAIGRARETADTRASLPDGREIDGLDGLRGYLLGDRRDDFVRQFCRKLLGYGLGRAVQLSDKPLVDEMVAELAGDGYRVGGALERIVLSRQFLEIRGKDAAVASSQTSETK